MARITFHRVLLGGIKLGAMRERVECRERCAE